MTDVQLWWISLGLFAVVVVVVALLLGIIIAAAKSIDRRAADIWVAGKQIAGNTVSIWLLDRTNDALTQIRDDARGLTRAVRGLDQTLRSLGR
jgi:hypothetical protein